MEQKRSERQCVLNREAACTMYTHTHTHTHEAHTTAHPQFSEYFPLQRIVRLTKYSISCNWKIHHFAEVHRHYNTATLYQSLLLLLLCTDVSVRPGR